MVFHFKGFCGRWFYRRGEVFFASAIRHDCLARALKGNAFGR